MALFVCWYIIKSAKCPFTVLLIYYQQRNVSYSVICVFMISQQQKAIDYFACLSTKFDKSTTEAIGYFAFLSKTFDASTNTTSIISAQVSMCHSQMQCLTTMLFVCVFESLVATCVVRRPISATSVWEYINARIHTQK